MSLTSHTQLPPEIWHAVFDRLTVLDLYRVCCSGKAMAAYYDSWIPRGTLDFATLPAKTRATMCNIGWGILLCKFKYYDRINVGHTAITIRGALRMVYAGAKCVDTSQSLFIDGIDVMYVYNNHTVIDGCHLTGTMIISGMFYHNLARALRYMQSPKRTATVLTTDYAGNVTPTCLRGQHECIVCAAHTTVECIECHSMVCRTHYRPRRLRESPRSITVCYTCVPKNSCYWCGHYARTRYYDSDTSRHGQVAACELCNKRSCINCPKFDACRQCESMFCPDCYHVNDAGLCGLCRVPRQ